MGFLCCVCCLLGHIAVCVADENGAPVAAAEAPQSEAQSPARSSGEQNAAQPAEQQPVVAEQPAQSGGQQPSEPTEEEKEKIVDEQGVKEMSDIKAAMEELRWNSEKASKERQQFYKRFSELSKRVTDLSQSAYDEAKAKEQSEGNKNLEMFSQATMGIGAMQLAQGIAEKQADAAADADMEAYIQTMRCTYAGKSVKWGPDKIELPNTDLMPYQMEYKYLAQVLKERKAALGLKPGIEAEEILDKASSGLYDDENVGNMGGAYGSRYRAAAGNAKDKGKLSADKKEAKTRMIAGGVIAGAGLVGSMIADYVINKDSKVGKIKDERDKAKAELQDYMKQEVKKCNEQIQKHKELAEKIKNNPKLANRASFKRYTDLILSMQPMSDNVNIDEFKGHPICR